MNQPSVARPETQEFLDSRLPFSLPGVGEFFHVCRFDGWRGGGPQCGRPSAQAATHVPGLWVDLDVGKTFPDIYHCHRWLETMERPPTFQVETGGGVHGYWLWGDEEDGELLPRPESPEVAAIEDAYGAADDGLRTLPARFVAWARDDIYEYCRDRRNGLMAWTPALDSVGDLARIMRSPGSLNPKYDPPRPVRVTHDDGPRYVPSDFDWVPDLPGAAVPLPAADRSPRASGGAIVQQGAGAAACAGDGATDDEADAAWGLVTENWPEIEAVWLRSPGHREPPKDKSHSGYDSMILGMLVRRLLGYPNGVEIAARLARRHSALYGARGKGVGAGGVEKWNRPEIWGRRLESALTFSQPKFSPLGEEITAVFGQPVGTAPVPRETSPPPDGMPSRTLDLLRVAAGDATLDLEAVARVAETGEYRIEGLSSRSIRLDSTVVIPAMALAAHKADGFMRCCGIANLMPLVFDGEVWRNLQRAMVAEAVVRQEDVEGTPHVNLRAAIQGFVLAGQICENERDYRERTSTDEAIRPMCFIDRKGNPCVPYGPLRYWAKDKLGLTDTAQWASSARRLGARSAPEKRLDDGTPVSVLVFRGESELRTWILNRHAQLLEVEAEAEAGTVADATSHGQPAPGSVVDMIDAEDGDASA